MKVSAQTDKELLAELVAQDEDAINALVLYPEDTRSAILEATKYPEVLIKLESIQTQTSTAFRDLINNYPRATQEMIWDLTRYPGLIELLVEAGPEKQRDVNLVLKDYPEIVHDRAKKAVRSHSSLLVEVNELNQHADVAFSSLLADYPPPTAAALKKLLDLPEVLTILTENIRLTVLIGDMYSKEPDWVLNQIDSLNLVVASENAKELEDWKSNLEDDPQAMEELEASAEAFQQEYGYDDLYYDPDQQYDDLYYEEEREERVRVTHEYYHYHFPYWFSYPFWYEYPRWRLYPRWYDWGFYFGPRRTIVVVNLPSFYFTHWYFYHPHHHYRWSYLSSRFTRHYHRHPRTRSSITTGVSVWRNRNREVVSDRWLKDDSRLSDRFREFGKFEADRDRYNRSHPGRELGQKDFRERNPQRYRTLSGTVTGRQRATERTRVQPAERTERTAPRTRSTVPSTRKKQPATPRRSVKKGTERHRSISERSRTSRTRTVRPRTPQTKAPRRTAPRTRSAPATRKKTTTRKRNN